jgi:hypothetical protein
MAFDVQDRRELGIPMPVALERWNNGGFSIEPGMHDYVPLHEQATVLVDNGYGELIPVDITVSIHVEQKLFFSNLPIKELSGFKDELSGHVITNAFTTGIFHPYDVWENWKALASLSEAPQPPVMTLTGLVGYDADGE